MYIDQNLYFVGEFNLQSPRKDLPNHWYSNFSYFLFSYICNFVSLCQGKQKDLCMDSGRLKFDAAYVS